MYRRGTYKLNLGLNEDIKKKLDFIMKYYEVDNIAETIRCLIDNEYILLRRPNSVSAKEVKESINDLSECLKIIDETKEKLKEKEKCLE